MRITTTVWTGREARLLREALRSSQREFAERLGVSPRTVARWDAEGTGIRLRNYLQEALDTVLAQASADARDRFALTLASPFAALADGATPGGLPADRAQPPRPVPAADPAADGPLPLLAAAAAASAEFAGMFARNNTDDATLESLTYRLCDLATAYVHAPLIPLVRDIIAVRDDVFGLLRGRQPPRRTADLLLLASCSCLLLAHAAQNLGDHAGAAAHAEASRTLAQQTGDPTLLAWVTGSMALIAEWSPWAGMSLGFADQAALLAPPGQSRIRIAAIEGRAAARIGDRARAARALRRLEQARSELPGDGPVNRFGGVLTFPEAKLDCYLGATHALLGDHERAAEHCRAAIAAYQDGPVSQRSYGDEALARIDLVASSIALGDLPGAHALMEGLVQLPAPLRIRQIGTAVARIKAEARRAARAGRRQMSELADLAEQFDLPAA
ncbi:MAG TPA: helix-turn-helix transcriptional regulator [Actinocrinis sp.]|jgi:transcriptional regulator with XRE-family HTH domain